MAISANEVQLWADSRESLTHASRTSPYEGYKTNLAYDSTWATIETLQHNFCDFDHKLCCLETLSLSAHKYVVKHVKNCWV